MVTTAEAASKLILPMDYRDGIYCEDAQELITGLKNTGVVLKIGTVTCKFDGWIDPIFEATDNGFEVFADTKAYDVKNTVEDTLDPIMDTNPLLINMHSRASDNTTSTFIKMVRIKRQELLDSGEVPKLISLAVTLLTDITDEQCQRDYGRSRNEEVYSRALTAREFGFDGVVCSAEDLDYLNSHEDTEVLEKVVAGIRPLWAVPNGQQNIVTPRDAINRGATRLVCGSPITKDYNLLRDGATQLDAANDVIQEIKGAYS